MACQGSVDVHYSGDLLDRLNKDCDRVLDEKQRLQLLQTMKKRNIYTRDIMAFAVNQADTRRVLKVIDNRTTHSAMTTKIKDSKESLRMVNKEKSMTIRAYLDTVGGKKYRLRRTLKAIRHTQDNMRKKTLIKYQNKIEHLE